MQVYVVTHPEAGLIGVFASEADWERYAQQHSLDNDYDFEWVEVQGKFSTD